jgi:hypothetical protein
MGTIRPSAFRRNGALEKEGRPKVQDALTVNPLNEFGLGLERAERRRIAVFALLDGQPDGQRRADDDRAD